MVPPFSLSPEKFALSENLDATPGSPGALDRLSRRFRLVTQPVKVGDIELTLPELAAPVAYITERMERGERGEADLPYWTKLWPAALVLAQFAASMPAVDDRPLLELGSGMGLPGLAAAAAGHQVVLSDLDPDALEFAQAAAEINGLEDRVTVRSLDWTSPGPDLGTFGTVLGAEILYHPPLYGKLVDLLDRLVTGDGTIFLSHQQRPFLIGFFAQAQERYRIRRTSRTLRSDGDETKVFLYALNKSIN